jgi:hypothetical protein
MSSRPSSTFPPLVPVFPLPNVVLFPKALLRLRIFEPRYRSMLKDVLDSHGCIAMALFKPGWEADYFGNPEVFPMVGVGRVIEYSPAEDGTYRIRLLGERRAEIREWIGGRPYRMAKVAEVIEEEPGPEEREELRERLRRYLDLLISKEKSLDEEARSRIDEEVSTADELGFLVDSIAYHFLVDPREKQELLEVPNALEREKLLRNFLLRHLQIAPDGSSPENAPPGGKGEQGGGPLRDS